MMKPIEILLVEDNPGDVRLTKELLYESRIKNNLNVVTDGEEAIEYLFQRGQYSEVSLPDLILLDLNLPKKDGREVLEEIKKTPVIKRIPVVVLTTSSDHNDIGQSYDRHANCYVTKPVGLDQFSKIVHSIEDFWFSIVKLPTDLDES